MRVRRDPDCCSTAESSYKRVSERQWSPRLANWESGCGSCCATKSITRSSALEEIFCGSVVRPMRGCLEGIAVLDDRLPELGDPPPSSPGGSPKRIIMFPTDRRHVW